MADPRPGVRLGLDIGSVRIGVARSDPRGTLATPVSTITRPRTGADRTVAEIAGIVAELEVVEVIVGLPRTLQGKEGAAAAAARAYAGDLAAAVTVPVRMVDERLTTVSAHQAMHASGRSGRRHRSVVDQVAAVMILQSALDLERSTGRPPGEHLPPTPVDRTKETQA
ncbi:Holliday junction resolvase RuvX [Pseudactinotalea sp. HY158]|uniref:Holliday junction resolvase RuvX n=1 Tax=Pseudactinotalea sp. HY158 TaxID=2654547 RepID=UPI00129C3E74|nr:Holliday junction resolvase RuvX [Pseudactinotalea sp. HY158]QGH69356.1 Holliday junction resolvase RuvX [Pseudactinotalea sp. HY158]